METHWRLKLMDDDYAMRVILAVGLTILGGLLLWLTIVSYAPTLEIFP